MFLWLLAGFFLLIWIYLRRNYGKLEKCGMPVIPPFLCFGSGPWAMHKYQLAELDEKRVAKYGKVFGAYILSQPVVYLADADLIKQITTKDFESFHGHLFKFGDQKFRTLDIADGEEWKELRKGMSPIFTSGKIKGMLQYVNCTLDNMMEHLEKRVKEDPVIDLKPVFQKMTMDVIGKCAFGIEINCFKGNTDLLRLGNGVFDGFKVKNVMDAFFMNIFLGFSGIENYLDMVPPEMKELWKIFKNVENGRKVPNGDFIDKMAEMKKQVQNGELKHLSEDQITSQSIIFLIAGYETTASTLGALCYQLVKNTEVLEKLVAEIDEVLEKFDGKLDHETVAEMPYLEACIKETLRFSSPVSRNDRLCNKDFEYKGIKIPKGTSIGICNQVVHFDPEYWPEPYMFKPERFLKENAGSIVPCSWLPFGAGPRACIGERFAMIEMKMGTVRLLSKYKIEIDSTTRYNIDKGEVFMALYTDMFIKLTER
uniref:CYP3027-like protein n=1 Tax=Eurytemora affinis TaxID=88015 RepID=A0A8B0MC28_EURAF|nr:CYP3027-like protein [Eurytemora affinis]